MQDMRTTSGVVRLGLVAGLLMFGMAGGAIDQLATDVRLTASTAVDSTFAAGCEVTVPVSLDLTTARLDGHRLTVWHTLRWVDAQGKRQATDPVEDLAFKPKGERSGVLTDVQVKLPAETAQGTIGFLVVDKDVTIARASCPFVTTGGPLAPVPTEEPTRIGSRLEVFWDDALIDCEKTTAERRIHQPEYAGEIMTFDKPWEGDGCGYHVIIPDRDEQGDYYRLYYRGWSIGQATPENTTIPKSDPCICYAESRDGLTWTRPELGLCEFNGSTKNNIMLKPKHFGFTWDNIFFFKDANPDCPADERYKAIAGHLEKDEDFGLWCFLSADGLHWRKGWILTKDGEFDSHNVAFWDPERKAYQCYYRYHHFLDPQDRHDNFHSRDVRHMTSVDFRTWTDAERLSYGEGTMDYALYTNCVMPYPRAPHLYVGFPTRYVMRKGWTDSHDKLPGLANRRFRAKANPRYGIAITDCAFMVSRDGVNFQREEDAFMDPGPENPVNWLYGDAYPFYGFMIQPGRRPGSDPELSFFCSEGYWSGRGQTMCRYALRMDGFVSRHAPDAGAKLVTKPFIFDGTSLRLNFRTSAYGQIFVTLRTADGTKAIRSSEIFGNKIDRVVGFPDGNVTDFAGLPVVLEFDMHDADIYAFQFAHR